VSPLLRSALPPLFSVLFLIGTWQMLATTIKVGGLALPTPGLVWSKAAEQWHDWQSDRADRVAHAAMVARTASEQGLTYEEASSYMPYQGRRLFVEQILLSLQTVFLGVGMGLVIAVPLGILCGLSKFIQAVTDPAIQLLKPVSPLAWFPVVYLVINRLITSQDPAIAKSTLIAAIVVALCSLWPALINTAQGVTGIDRDHRNVARVLNLSWPRTVWSIVLPSAAPSIFTGVRLSLGVGWMVLIAAEMMAVSPGIGGFIWDWYQSSNDVALSYLVLAVIVIGIIGFLLDRGCVLLQRAVARGIPSSVR
jgi:nitrate/nitrite transport system permease protein